ncbi:hypothetical protein SEVIR_5G342400v4 [Setaria viridis]|uniref:Uncharacterized protein n=2 Tax=Setaria TaxID=4554 RepID=K3XMQ8_SETIT|nr:uncharacterized protein LOC101784875 [Setaria italica]XP_034594905.1 uncharacterized protein LOC117856664 [Setaria viridis]RCV27613.1 hypothetical protein SETIT_5G338300v2 [Setaria italica]TKW17084.1 hypothetical protein SEVIR_5G342400v2 [Setaria viridis]
MASLTTTTTSSPAALPAATTAPAASSVSPHAGSKRPLLAGDDAPWRATAAGGQGIRPVPRIHHAPVLRVAAQDDSAAYALAVMKHPDPIGEGLAMEAFAEAAGPECIVPGQQAPLRLMGLKVWPLDIDLKFLEPFGRELHSMKKFMDKSCSVMDSSMANN